MEIHTTYSILFRTLNSSKKPRPRRGENGAPAHDREARPPHPRDEMVRIDWRAGAPVLLQVHATGTPAASDSGGGDGPEGSDGSSGGLEDV